LDSLAIPRYDPQNRRARELSRLGTEASVYAVQKDERLDLTELLIDEAAASFWGISSPQQDAIKASLQALG
jgi:hypothetical protein